MNKFTFCLVSAFTILQCAPVFAQPFNTLESVDINNIKAAVLVHGDFNWDAPSTQSRCEFPKNSGLHVASATGIWMGGVDAGNQLHVSAQTYRQDGNDYWPGPLDNTGVLSMASSTEWAKIWKVNFFDINNHLANTTRTVNNTPASILEWPAKGNPYAKGNGGVSLIITSDMAPFVDVNSDGTYNPLAGDYPQIKGDQMLWWVFSDNGPTHDNHAAGTASVPLGVEVHAKAYAYNRGTLIDNVIYYEFDIMNKLGIDYNNFRMGINADMDLGLHFDDYVGFDSSQRLGYVYNGYPYDSLYGTTPPIAGYTLLKMPGDNGSNLMPVGSFMAYENAMTVGGNPQNDSQFYHYLNARFRDGARVKNDYIGHGTWTNGRGAGPETNYFYPGNPADTSIWSECSSYNPPGDRRFVLSTNDYFFNKNTTASVAFALVIADRSSTHACPNVDLSGIKTVTDTAWKNYLSPPKSYVSVEAITAGKALSLYPNPAKDILHITLPVGIVGHGGKVIVYDVTGKKMNSPYVANNNAINVDVKGIPAGVYNIVYANNEGVMQSALFVKE